MSLAEALRAEILRVISEAKDFTPSVCLQVERLARSGVAVLQAASGMRAAQGIAQLSPVNEYDGSDDGSVMISPTLTNAYPLSPAPAVETFGNKVIQELLTALPALMNRTKEKENPLTLVRAMKEAKEAGFSEIAMDLEERLTGLVAVGRSPKPEGPSAASEPAEENVPEEGAPEPDSKPMDFVQQQQQQTRKLSTDEVRRLQEINFGAAAVPVAVGAGITGVVNVDAQTFRAEGPHEFPQSGEAKITQATLGARHDIGLVPDGLIEAIDDIDSAFQTHRPIRQVTLPITVGHIDDLGEK